ncbi:pertactin-like passenger domain-containing protein, partial [Streptobacillus ratti]|uniref:pertactin-like passenger domain-containing protein n=1 Tax=Streptobacillus ratti TaxID=1720557 RepID=UPI000A6FD03E
QNSNWTFSDDEYKTNNEILVENATLNINKATLETKNFVNDKTSTINVLEKSKVVVNDKFTNKGIVSFLKNKKETDTFDIKGNYSGENGKLLMRAYTDKNESDMLKIDGSVNGNTGVELSSNKSLMNRRFNNKLKLIETKDSTQDAFNLLNPEHGVFKYKLDLEDNNWYLTQSYNKPVIGLITNVMEKARSEFNLSYNDHDNESNKVWTKVSNVFSKNEFEDMNNNSLDISSNISNVFMGYDIGDIDNRYKYGVFGNVGYEYSRVESLRGDSGVFGIGLYGTWRNKHFYTDSWINYTYIQNRINLKNVFNYGLHSLKTSIELGTRGDMYIGKSRIHASLYEQLILGYVTGYKADGLEYIGNTNVRSRLGTNITMYTPINIINPYVEFNWSYDINTLGVDIDGERDYNNKDNNTFELKWGLRDIDINSNLSMKANAVHRFNTQGNMGNG